MAAWAEEEEIGIATIGIAKDSVAEQGIRHLRRFGRFDEIMAGRGWRNAGVLRYIYDDFPGPAATPQVLVLRRTLANNVGQWEVLKEEVLVRKVGLMEIRNWVNRGATIPQHSSGP